jgi:hypothetical protein
VGKHALLSASSAYRWMICTKSVRATEHLVSKSSTFAEEGSFAHELSEVILSFKLNKISIDKYTTEINRLHNNDYYNPELQGYVDQYVDYVMEQAEGAVMVLIEQRVDYSNYAPEGFGTADVIIIKDGVLHVIDLKFGMGVRVKAQNNPQIRLYALGALELFSDIQAIQTTIVQVRLNSLTHEELLPEELISWAKKEIVISANLAYNNKGEFKAGDHCKFCPLKVTCIERANYNLGLASYDFAAPESLTDDDIADILGQAEELGRWVKDLQEYALDKARDEGRQWPGYELTLKPGNRRYTNEPAILENLTEAGFDIKDCMELKGITKLEKSIGKKRFDFIAGEYIERAKSKYVLKKAET